MTNDELKLQSILDEYRVAGLDDDELSLIKEELEDIMLCDSPLADSIRHNKRRDEKEEKELEERGY